MKWIALLFGWIGAAMLGSGMFLALPEFERKAGAEEIVGATQAAVWKTDLNTATLRELEKLPGLGPELAKRVVQHRPYHKLDELIAKKVLGRKQFARIKEQIRVDPVQQTSKAP